jgi:hypothetical protein
VAVASLVVAVVAIIIALVSVRSTRRQAIASGRQAVASEAVTAIEGQRRHEELTPVLAITADARPGVRWVDMTVELTGPPGLGGLDEVMIRIRDDMPDRKPGAASQLTEEQISEVIWGPYRLNPGMRDTDSAGRAHGPFPLPVHEPHPLQLEPTTAPAWSDPASWHRQHEGKPVRVEVILHPRRARAVGSPAGGRGQVPARGICSLIMLFSGATLASARTSVRS